MGFEALARQGITEPFQIQKITIKEGLGGDDICGRAPTGSGKTLAFGIPLVVRTKRQETTETSKPHPCTDKRTSRPDLQGTTSL